MFVCPFAARRSFNRGVRVAVTRRRYSSGMVGALLTATTLEATEVPAEIPQENQHLIGDVKQVGARKKRRVKPKIEAAIAERP